LALRQCASSSVVVFISFPLAFGPLAPTLPLRGQAERPLVVRLFFSPIIL
jgi:hypothetical protein